MLCKASFSTAFVCTLIFVQYYNSLLSCQYFYFSRFKNIFESFKLFPVRSLVRIFNLLITRRAYSILFSKMWLEMPLCYCCSVTKSCLTLCDSMDYSMPGFPVLHHLSECAQTHVYWVSDAIQPSHLLSYPSPLAFNLSQYQGLFQWVSSSYQVAQVLKLQLQHQSFQWIFPGLTDVLG